MTCFKLLDLYAKLDAICHQQKAEIKNNAHGTPCVNLGRTQDSHPTDKFYSFMIDPTWREENVDPYPELKKKFDHLQRSEGLRGFDTVTAASAPPSSSSTSGSSPPLSSSA